MPDTMMMTKVVGGFCGALLIFLLGGWAAEILYHVGGHSGEEQAYVIDTGEEDEAAEEEVEVAFADVYAAADAGAGERLFRQCSSCHNLEDGANATGPHLYNVVGRDIASIDSFAYSDALAGKEGAWTPEELDGFLLNPRDYAPGTLMGYSGMDDVEDRANLIAYLDNQGS